MKRKVIIVTDGDDVAKKAIEIAARNIGGRTISASTGNPTPLSGSEIVELIKQAANDPVVVMVDDNGDPGRGWGERAMKAIASHPDIQLLGVIAVASNTEGDEGIEVDISITKEGEISHTGVDKDGVAKDDNHINGDTLSVLKELKVPIIVGMGDVGKMNYQDDIQKGAPLTTKALKKILEANGK